MAGPFDPWRNNYDIPGPQDPRRRDEIRPSVAPRWEELLPGSTVTAINQNPVAQALGRFLSKPSTGIGEVTRVSPIDGRPVPPEPGVLDKLPPTVQEGIGGLGLLANFIAPSAKAALPMDAASRAARAKAMGFDPKTTWYHGTPEPNLKTIEPGRRDPGAWFTTSVNNAQSYARGDGANLHSVRLKSENPYIVEFDYPNGGADPVPFHKGQPIPFEDNVSIVKYAQSRGYDSVRFPNGNFTEADDTMVVFKPQQIRDVNAAFDPEQKSSPLLMASRLGPVGLGVLAKLLADSGGPEY